MSDLQQLTQAIISGGAGPGSAWQFRDERDWTPPVVNNVRWFTTVESR